MIIEVRVQRRTLVLTADKREPIHHKIPRKNKFFKEELRQFREEITAWLMGERVEELHFVFPEHLTFYHRQLNLAILRATQVRGYTYLITTTTEKGP